MDTNFSSQVVISVKTQFQGNLPTHSLKKFYFQYTITVENNSNFTVQLLRRNWEITESDGEITYIDGAGVVGVQPIIKPNEKFHYTSGCHFYNPIGRMKGYYVFRNHENNELFKVSIPEFVMEVPYSLN